MLDLNHKQSSLKRINAKHFLYCLHLSLSDHIYWGSTGDLYTRLSQHLIGDVDSTCHESFFGCPNSAYVKPEFFMSVVYVVPYRSQQEAYHAEIEAWQASGSTHCFNSHRTNRIEFAKTVPRRSALPHLRTLGWPGYSIPLNIFISSHVAPEMGLSDEDPNALLKIYDHHDELKNIIR